MLTLTYEFQIKPNRQQEILMESYLEISRKVYNYALAERKAWIESRKCAVNACSIRHEYIIPADAPKPSYARQCKSLAAAKKLGNTLKLPKIGSVKMRLSRPIPDGFELKQVRVVRQALGWYAMLILQINVEVPDRMPHGEPIGIDLGLHSFVATSDGELIARPKFFVDLQGKLKSLQRKLKHKKKGSNNWRKLQAKVARLHEHISNTRKDFHFKLAHRLCDRAGMIFAEDLNLKALSRGMLCKHTLDAGWGQFQNILKWVCWKRDAYFALVEPNGTSQTCPHCLTHMGKKELSERVHECQHCGYRTDRDVAAGKGVGHDGKMAI